MSLHFDVNTRVLQTIDPTINPSNFTVDFPHNVLLDGIDYEMAIIKLNSRLSFHNIYGNKAMTYIANGTTYTVPVPDGLYGVTALNALLYENQVINGIINSGDPAPIQLKANVNTNKMVIVIDDSLGSAAPYTFVFDGSTSSLHDIFGFNIGSLSSGANSSPNVPDFTDGIDTLKINCSLINHSFNNGFMAQTILSYSIPTGTSENSNYTIEPINPTYYQIRRSNIERIDFTFTDQTGDRLIDLQGEHLNFLVEIRPAK